MIVRGHQLVQEGFFHAHNNKCLTLFSAPNYCLRSGNHAAFMCLNTGSQPEM
jgi:hypothetical protein